ncbi:Phenylalanine--tRNA ligase beta subunit [Trichinella spiralis]|uniref:Phenylalanine--tRNA ligase beta subunit n=1 Tax=Trichinella spiralis TaxID=6334 RepID=A0ABR3KP53_TRISP
MRKEIACAGFTEILTFSLCSRGDVSMKLQQPEELNRAVEIANPKTLEFQATRTLLLPGILKTLAHNKDKALPLKLFEIQDVVERDEYSDCDDPVNRRHFCAVYYGKTSGFETIHGYCIKEDLLPFYFPGRCASIMLRGEKKIGHMGILHPSVCEAFDLNLVCSCLELCFEHVIETETLSSIPETFEQILAAEETIGKINENNLSIASQTKPGNITCYG